MSTSTASAKKHLNKAEFELYTASQSKKITELTPYRLKQKVSRLQKLKSKYSTVKRAQKRGLKAKGFDASAQSNRKVKLEFINKMIKSFQLALKKRVELDKKAEKEKKLAKKTAKKKVSKKATKKKVTKKTAKKTKKK